MARIGPQSHRREREGGGEVGGLFEVNVNISVKDLKITCKGTETYCQIYMIIAFISST